MLAEVGIASEALPGQNITEGWVRAEPTEECRQSEPRRTCLPQPKFTTTFFFAVRSDKNLATACSMAFIRNQYPRLINGERRLNLLTK